MHPSGYPQAPHYPPPTGQPPTPLANSGMVANGYPSAAQQSHLPESHPMAPTMLPVPSSMPVPSAYPAGHQQQPHLPPPLREGPAQMPYSGAPSLSYGSGSTPPAMATQNLSNNYPPSATGSSVARKSPIHPSLMSNPIDQLTGQMQHLSTQHNSASSMAQPVGIIGQPLPLQDLHREPLSPILPQLDPAYMRITLPKVPKTAATLHKTKLPFGLTITPYPIKHQVVLYSF